MYQFEQNNTLATSFPTLHSKDKHKTITRPYLSATQNLLDIPLARTNKYDKGSVKYQCIRDWKLQKEVPTIIRKQTVLYENQKNSTTSYF